MIDNYIFLLSIGVLGVVCVGLITTVYRLQKRMGRTTRHTQHEFQTLRYEAAMRLLSLEKQFYHQSGGEERLVYDGRNEIKANDFTGNGARAWDYLAHRFADGGGEGAHRIQDNVLTVHRTNAQGRYELYLQRFAFDGKVYDHVPADDAKAARTLRLTFEVKKESASHILRFVFKGKSSKEVLDEKDYTVFNPDWQKAELFFTVAATEDALFRMDDLSVMQAPSSVALRNLVLFEKQQPSTSQ